MSVMDLLNNGARSLTGAVQKAYITFDDDRVDEIHVAEPLRANRGMKLDKLANAAKAISVASAKVSNVLGGLTTGNLGTIGEKNIYEVKFNPSEMTFQAYSGGTVQKANNADNEVGVEFANMKPHIVLNLPLIFDDYERTDAFMLEKFGDITAAARTLVSEGGRTLTGGTYSVRPQVEGFIGALRNQRTRKVTFHWGKMAYSGFLQMVDAVYTMFNMEGHPIRAKVTLTILIADETVGYGNMGRFVDSYEKIFDKEGSRMGSIVQNAGNLINLKL